MSVAVRRSIAPYWWIIIVRGLRSLSQGYLNVVAPLYLLSLGMTATGLGGLFTASFLVGALLLVPVGIMADRSRRLPFLMIYTILMVIWGCVYAELRFLPALLSISVLAGIGRGGGGQGGGQSGPFTPAEQALLADLVKPGLRPKVYTWNSSIAALTAAAGAALSGLPTWFPWLRIGPFTGDRVLFLATAAIGLLSLALLWQIPEAPPEPRVRNRHENAVLSPASSRMVLRQILAGSSNAFGQGFVQALFVIWLHARFHVDASVIGPIFAASFLVQAGSFFVATLIARHVGSVRTIFVTRLVAAVLMAAIAFAPTVTVAAILQVLRTAVATMITPVRQSFTMSLYPPRERASATAFTGLGRRVFAAISPSISGVLIASGEMVAPFLLGGFFQILSATIYWHFFSRYDQTSAEPNGSDMCGPDQVVRRTP